MKKSGVCVLSGVLNCRFLSAYDLCLEVPRKAIYFECTVFRENWFSLQNTMYLTK